jgi:hypothetical protein
MIILLSYALQTYYKPYLDDCLNKLERLSLVSSGLVIYSGVYLLAYSREGYSKNLGRAVLIYFLIVAFALGVFIIPWISAYRSVVSTMINGFNDNLLKAWDFLKGKKKDSASTDSEDNDESTNRKEISTQSIVAIFTGVQPQANQKSIELNQKP